ncbi:lipoyl(octanoyl) transferase LipB [Candidatus Sumerlaeota bacterium]|nr:lipoyl(octanoyl) transferase LipB [Candidatus Sumerlaeota bacterium]
MPILDSHPPIDRLSLLLASAEAARLDCFNLGDYASVLALQEKLHSDRMADRIPDTWLLGEHPAVITQGIRGSAEDLIGRSEKASVMPVVKIDRGGMTTLHSPGQLILYAVVKLREGSLGGGQFSRALVQSMRGWIQAEFGVVTQTRPHHPGLFHNGEKLLSVGISARGGVTTHGIALNMNNDLGLWDSIIPCGDASIRPTTLTHILGRTISPQNRTESVAAWLRDTWGYAKVVLHSE